MYKIKNNLTKLKRISKKHDFYLNPNGIYLNRNERIIQFSNQILKKIRNSITSESLSLYPDFNLFYKKISNWLNVKESEIFLNEGVSGLVKTLFETFCDQGKSNVIIPFPTFAMYEIFAKIYKVKIKKLKYDKKFKINLDDIFRVADKNTSLIILPNPNVPIEGFLDLTKIKKILNFCKKNKIMLVIDEVYYPFSKSTSIELFSKYKSHFIILRSFSKAFGLAGIRLGYAIGSKKNIKYLSKVRGGYETNNLSVLAASVLIDNYHQVIKYVDDIKNGMKFFQKKLKKIGIPYVGGNHGNYIFVSLKNKTEASKIYNELKYYKIYVRSGWPKPYDNGLLISGSNIKIMKDVSKVFENFFYNE